VVAYSVAVPETHSQFTLIFTLPSAPVGAFFFWGSFWGWGLGFGRRGTTVFFSPVLVQLRLLAFVVAERLVRGWMHDEVCGGVCRGEARIYEGICGMGIS
jgi:hypothetical protein